jgi:hypothetical protein
MQMRRKGAGAGRDGISLERRSAGFMCGRATPGFLGRVAFLCGLEESFRDRHNQMDPRCSDEPAYEEDAATD